MPYRVFLALQDDGWIVRSPIVWHKTTAKAESVNTLSRWLGHANLSTTLIYLELMPDPAGSLAQVP